MASFLCLSVPSLLLFPCYFDLNNFPSCRILLILIFWVQTSSDFDAKPMVMLLGQYSTGKTTFIKHLLRTSYPGFNIYQMYLQFFPQVSSSKMLPDSLSSAFAGAHIGPEPTTDRFVVVMVS